MSATTVVIAIFAAMLAISLLLWIGLLWVGARWAKIEGVTFARLAGIAVIGAVLGVVGDAVFLASSSNLFIGVVTLAICIFLEWGVIATLLNTSFLRAVLAWLPTVLHLAVMLGFMLLALRPFCCEAFVIPTNAMAPTLLGHHYVGKCVACDAPAYCSPGPPGMDYAPRPERPVLMICGNFHATMTTPGREVFGGDRIMVAKWLKPRRWDLVVFRYPEDPSTNYVKRLVGLPGETVVIQQGKVWIDGTAIDPPPHLAGLRYVSQIPDFPVALSGSPQSPAVLADDEYFVLGDFTEMSKDSRLWQKGALGHPPYAVPEDHLVGVVTHIYWPPSRAKTLR